MIDLAQPEVTTPTLKYDYDQIAPGHRDRVMRAAQTIREAGAAMRQNVMRVGQELIEVKKRLDYGQFGNWLQAEFDMSERTAERMMSVAKRFADRSDTVSVFSEGDKQEAAETATILLNAGYAVEDMDRFLVEVWAHDWRWKKNRERPKPEHIREEIGKLRATIPEVMFQNGVSPPAQSAGEAAVDSFFERLARQDHQHGH